MRKLLLLVLMLLMVIIGLSAYWRGASEQYEHDDSTFLENHKESNAVKIDEFGDIVDLEDINNIIVLVKEFNNIKKSEKPPEELPPEELPPGVLPRDINDIQITKELRDILNSWPGGAGYDKLNYRLELFSRLSSCLGEKEPDSGNITIFFHFDIDHEAGIATGGNNTGGEPIRVDGNRSTLSQENTEIVFDCLLDSHMGAVFDTKALMDYNRIRYPGVLGMPAFEMPVLITFPIKNDPIYDMIGWESGL